MRTPNLSLLTIAMAGSLAIATPALAAQWNLASPYGDASFHTQNTKQFAEDVTEATDGELTITVHSGGSLISHAEIKPSVRRGTVQAGEIFLSTSRRSTKSTPFPAWPAATPTPKTCGRPPSRSSPSSSPRKD